MPEICLRCKKAKGIQARGLCGTCYVAVTRDGTLQEYPLMPKPKPRKCAKRDCQNQAVAKGYCWNCYREARRMKGRLTA